MGRSLRCSRASTKTQLADVVQPTEILVRASFRPGQPIPAGETIWFFYNLMLDLYEITLRNSGDGPIVKDPSFKRVFDNRLEILIAPNRGGGISFGAALFAIQSILYSMLHPRTKSGGFYEQVWEVSLAPPQRRSRKLGTVTLFATTATLMLETLNTV